MDKETIQKLMEKATKGPWVCMEKLGKTLGDHGWRNVCDAPRKGKLSCVYASADNMVVTDEKGTYYRFGDDAEFIAALPDIAQTALGALQRVEELEKETAMLNAMVGEGMRQGLINQSGGL